MVLESMDGQGEAGLLPSILEAYCRQNPRRKDDAKPPDSPAVHEHEQVLELLQDFTHIYSPPDLPSNEEFEALVEETTERQPSSSPDPLSGEWIFEPWPLLRTIKQGDDFNAYGMSPFPDVSTPVQTHDPWGILGFQDHSGPLYTSHQSSPPDLYESASFLPGSSIDSHPRRTYSDPGFIEESAPSDHQTSFALPQSGSDTNLDRSAMAESESTILATKLHGRVDQSSSASAQRTINGSSRGPVPPRSGLGTRGLERPQDNKRALGVEDAGASHVIQQPRRKKQKPLSQSNYTREEKRWVVYYLKREVSQRNFTESKWENVSRKLMEHGLRRSKCSIKAWWSRYGREETGFDERQNPNGRSLITSRQDPEDRKKARRLKKQQQLR
ncbi:MAG: hypothetical protein Q9221_007912 [Calogaya cf. arnoldii]